MKERIPVFIEGQDDLIDLLATAMCSICYNTEAFIDFYILDCGICDFNKKQINKLKNRFDNFSVEFLPIDLRRFDGMKGWPPPKHLFLDCYARLLIPELKLNLKKAIYIDSDVIALGDIKFLWEQDLDGFELGAIADIGYEKHFYDNCVNKLGVSKDHIYPNAGVLLIDCQKWRENNVTEKLLEIGREKKDDLLVLNEDILSIYYNNNNYKLLDNRFNLTDLNNRICKNVAPQITDEYLAEEWKHVVIYHFCHGKPFKRIKNHYNDRTLKHFDSFWFFASMTPFFDGMKLRLLDCINENNMNLYQKCSYKIFGIFTLVSYYLKNGVCRYKLFGLIPFMKKKIVTKRG